MSGIDERQRYRVRRRGGLLSRKQRDHFDRERGERASQYTTSGSNDTKEYHGDTPAA